MNQPDVLLDLSITFLPPPPDASPETLASITLSCEQLQIVYAGIQLTDPITSEERESLLWYLEEYWKWPYLEFASRGKQVEELLHNVGNRLYHAVFGDIKAQALLEQWQKQLNTQHQISIVSDMPRVLSLPWELLHDEYDFLVLHRSYPIFIVRRLLHRESPTFSTIYEPPLRILLITARPEGMGFIDPRSIARELMDEVQAQVESGAIEIEFLRPPTFSALYARLKDTQRPIHVLHFDGHGIFDEGTYKQGILAFETKAGGVNFVKANDLASVVRGSNVGLVVLTACQSAISATDDIFSSIAMQLIHSNVEAVVAMSASLLVASASRYAEALYHSLAAGTSVSVAQDRARQALYDDPRRHPNRRRREEERTPVELHDWWLPHFYQQRPVLLQANVTERMSRKTQQTSFSLRLSQKMPTQPRHGFSGRAREMHQLERWLVQGKLVVIHGFGGIGKTALARETADWLTRTGMYIGACFISFERGGNLEMFLTELGTYLHINDSHYHSSNQAMASKRLALALQEKRILLIADSLESILPGGESPLDAEERTALWNVLLELRELGAGVLLTSRGISFSDERLNPGRNVTHLALEGLHPEDSYELACRLLDNLGVDRKHVPYVELRDLLAQLDHHPLTIQLVLPMLRQVPLAKIRSDFTTLLPMFVDDTEAGRNQSLLASLEYSFQALSNHQQSWLDRLTPFEGGANEGSLLEVTEIPNSEWVKLRSALEQTSLLTVDQIHHKLAIPFLRFHPLLTPFLRYRYKEDDALRKRYVHSYCSVSVFIYQDKDREPHAIRGLVQRELPNLQRTLNLLLEAGEIDDASNLVQIIAEFLTISGLKQESEALQRRVAEAAKDGHEDGTLTAEEYLRQQGLAQSEFDNGSLHTASTRLFSLLSRIEALPAGSPLGPGSPEHSFTLGRLARIIRTDGQLAVAENLIHRALAINDALLKKQPESRGVISGRSELLTELGNVKLEQGHYLLTHEAYEEALKIDKQLENLRGQAIIQGQLGMLALKQKDYIEAQTRYLAVLKMFRALHEPEFEANAWHNLGLAFENQREWNEAESCFRESLAIKERFGYQADMAITCNQLGIIAKRAGRPIEAEGWYKRALDLEERANSLSPLRAIYSLNIAILLLEEVMKGKSTSARLDETRNYAKQAVAIMETLNTQAELWKPLGTLALLADMEGQTEESKNYRRREREAFANFADNRYDVDRKFGTLITAVAATTKGDTLAKVKVEAFLPLATKEGFRIADAIERILLGERDWHLLVEGMDLYEALLVLRILETIAIPSKARPSAAEVKTAEQIIASLPIAIRKSLFQGDVASFRQAFRLLSSEEQQAVDMALNYLQDKQDVTDQEANLSTVAEVVQQFEPLLQTIVAVARGETTQRSKVEITLTELETMGWKIKGAVHQIWRGERDGAVLTEKLDEQDAALVQKILENIAEV